MQHVEQTEVESLATAQGLAGGELVAIEAEVELMGDLEI